MTTVGSKIKSIRTSKNITLQELGKATELSASYISQVERCICSISITSLQRLADALNTSIDAFISNDPEDGFDFFPHQRECVSHPGQPFYYSTLSNDRYGKTLDCRNISMLPGYAEFCLPLGKEGFIYILSGCLDVYINDIREQMFHGDSLCYTWDMNVRCYNGSKSLVTLLHAMKRTSEG